MQTSLELCTSEGHCLPLPLTWPKGKLLPIHGLWGFSCYLVSQEVNFLFQFPFLLERRVVCGGVQCTGRALMELPVAEAWCPRLEQVCPWVLNPTQESCAPQAPWACLSQTHPIPSLRACLFPWLDSTFLQGRDWSLFLYMYCLAQSWCSRSICLLNDFRVAWRLCHSIWGSKCGTLDTQPLPKASVAKF